MKLVQSVLNEHLTKSILVAKKRVRTGLQDLKTKWLYRPIPDSSCLVMDGSAAIAAPVSGLSKVLEM